MTVREKTAFFSANSVAVTVILEGVKNKLVMNQQCDYIRKNVTFFFEDV